MQTRVERIVLNYSSKPIPQLLPLGTILLAVLSPAPAQLLLYVRVPDSETRQELRYFRVLGTGATIHDSWDYVGSAHNKGFVYHVFELTVPEVDAPFLDED